MGNTLPTACSADSSGALAPQNPQPGNGPAPAGTIPCAAGSDGRWYPINISAPSDSSSSPAPSGSTSYGTPPPSYVPPLSTNGSTDHVINSRASTSSSLPANSPGRNAPTSSQASAAGGLPAGSPGVKQMTDLTGGSATSSSSKVAASGGASNTADTASAAPLAKGEKVRTTFVAVLALSWVLFGVAAFFFSLVCFGRSGSFGEKVFGFFLALLFGPFYFVYYFADGAYCRANAPTLF